MDSDDSDSELDIEGSATPDTNSMHGSFEGEQSQQPRKSSADNNNKSVESGSDSISDFVVRKPIPDSLHSFLGHIHQQQLQQHADNFLAKNWLKSESSGSALAGIGSTATGGLATLGGLGGIGGAGLPNALGGPSGNGLPSFFIPFSAAAAAAAQQIPFPNFLSQASLFHLKDSVWESKTDYSDLKRVMNEWWKTKS